MHIINPYDLKKKKFLDPESVIKELNIEEGKIALDFGSGSGFWTIPLAKHVGMRGLVIATDRSEENLSIVRKKAEREGIGHIKLLRAPYNSKIIPVDEKVDYIVVSNILTLTGRATELIRAMKKISNFGTKLLIVDWKKDSKFGLESNFQVTEGEIVQAANEAGFEFQKLLDAGSFHFALYFVYTGKIYEKK